MQYFPSTPHRPLATAEPLGLSPTLARPAICLPWIQPCPISALGPVGTKL